MKLSRRFKIAQVLNLTLFVFANTLHAQEANDPAELEKAIDRYIAPYIEMGDFSGTLLISQDGRIVVNKGYGYADVEHRVRHSPESKVHIASVSKTFTAAAILKLVEQGKISLDDNLRRFNLETNEDITIEHLLLHQSGLPDFWTLDDVNQIKMKKNKLSDLAGWVLKQPLEFSPGTRHEYSNSGYLILARIVEIVAEKEFEEALNELVLKPAGLSNTGHLDESRIIKDRAEGYDPWLPPDRIINTDFYDKSLLLGSGSLYSTTGDLFNWYRAVRENKLVDWSAFDYPFGWGRRRVFGRDCIQQSGRNPGCASHISAFLEEDVCIVILSNIQSDAVNVIQRDLTAIVFDEPYEVPETRKTISSDGASLEPMEGTYKLSDSSSLTVKRFGDALHLKATNGTFLPLERLGENEFFYRALYAKINFGRNENGDVTKLLWGGSYECAKLK